LSCLDITDQSYPCSQAEVIYVGRPKTLSFKVFYDEVDMLGDISDVAQTEAARRWQWRWEGRLWGYRTVGSGKRNGYMHHPPLVLSSRRTTMPFSRQPRSLSPKECFIVCYWHRPRSRGAGLLGAKYVPVVRAHWWSSEPICQQQQRAPRFL